MRKTVESDSSTGVQGCSQDTRSHLTFTFVLGPCLPIMENPEILACHSSLIFFTVIVLDISTLQKTKYVQSLLPLLSLVMGWLDGPAALDVADLSVVTWVLPDAHHVVPWVGPMILSLLCIERTRCTTFGRKVTSNLGAHDEMQFSQ